MTRTAAAVWPHSGPLAIVTLVSWLCTVSLGVYMLGTLIARGGLRQQRANKGGLPPAVLVGHFSLAISGLAVWVSYLATGLAGLAWSAVGLLIPAIGLGLSTVTLWTPYPGSPVPVPGSPLSGPGGGPAGGMPEGTPADTLASSLTDEMLVSALTDAERAGELIDELLARLLADAPPAARKHRGHLKILVPVAHGVAAGTTFLLALLTAAGAR